MQPISMINIESELSYAYLHAVASQAGMSCKDGNRHDDNNGIDATLTAWGPFPNGGNIVEVDLKIQLKATIDDPNDDGVNFEYFLRKISRYNDLRDDGVFVPRILVVLFLPKNASDWLTHTSGQLALQKCAYWQSLRGAPDVATSSGARVKLPKAQMFSPDGLIGLAARLSRRDFPRYPD